MLIVSLNTDADDTIMKSAPKRGAFENSATGYGKHRYNLNHSKQNSHKGSSKPDTKAKKAEEKPKVPKAEDSEKDLNSGFGTYLKSDEGVEMMKLFIFANTIMLILTMGWPHFKEQYVWFMQWWYSYNLEQ